MDNKTPQEKEKKEIKDLLEIYNESESCDKLNFSEMRTNIMLASGDHYNRQGDSSINRIRDSKNISPTAKIRLTKNHIGRISKIYVNSILSGSPNVTIAPANPKEIQHQKDAELNNSVLSWLKVENDIKKKTHLWAKDFVEVGEVFVELTWDDTQGKQIGWEPVVDSLGQPIPHPDILPDGTPNPMAGQMQQSDIPVMSGKLCFDLHHGFDVLRHPGVKSMDESPYLIIRKMEKRSELLKKFAFNPDAEKFIKDAKGDSYKVFQSQTAGYKKTDDIVLVRKHYYRPCALYPKGYYYIYTEEGILDENELPFGIFPIEHEAFDEVTTAPRGKSIIKQLRPYQIEINRASSKIAETQVTIGDDKIIYFAGAKPTSGANQPGIRFLNVNSPQAPVVVPGRNGEQYVDYVQMQIAEMYQVADVAELDKDMNGQLDPYTLLFRSMKQKQKFSYYSEKFELFLVRVHKKALELFRKYASPAFMIPVVGKTEQVNIEAFKSSKDMCWNIKVEPMSDDIETKFGKQITLNHILQYVGTTLDKGELGKFLRLSPYLNTEQMFQDLTQDWDNLVNDRLALDRGELPPANPYDNHDYMIKGLTARMKQPDFKNLHPVAQRNYMMKLKEHEEIKKQQALEIQRAQAGLIPSGGYAVACDSYVPDPKNPESTKRVRVPSEALEWLLKQLKIQGSAQEQIEMLGNTQAVADIAQLFNNAQGVNQLPQQMGTEGTNGYTRN